MFLGLYNDFGVDDKFEPVSTVYFYWAMNRQQSFHHWATPEKRKLFSMITKKSKIKKVPLQSYDKYSEKENSETINSTETHSGALANK